MAQFQGSTMIARSKVGGSTVTVWIPPMPGSTEPPSHPGMQTRPSANRRSPSPPDMAVARVSSLMPRPRCRQGGHFYGGGSNWGFHGGLVVAVATSTMETTVTAANIYFGGNRGGDDDGYGGGNDGV
jgi:hypothetical protein